MAKTKRFPKRRRPAPMDRRLRNTLDIADALKAEQRWIEARGLLEGANRAYPQSQEVLWRLMAVAVALDDAHLCQYGCERLFGLCPRDPDLPYMLSRAYIKNGWLSLAHRMAQHAARKVPRIPLYRQTGFCVHDHDARRQCGGLSCGVLSGRADEAAAWEVTIYASFISNSLAHSGSVSDRWPASHVSVGVLSHLIFRGVSTKPVQHKVSLDRD